MSDQRGGAAWARYSVPSTEMRAIGGWNTSRNRYVRPLLRLAFLAPEIVEAIAAGDQPPELTAEALAERIDLPLLWTARAKAVGISS
jgi:hypothetical protein